MDVLTKCKSPLKFISERSDLLVTEFGIINDSESQESLALNEADIRSRFDWTDTN